MDNFNENTEYFKIGEVAKMKGITTRALRFYEEKGLIAPAYIDPVTQYRYYSLDQLFRIEMIQHMRKSNENIKNLQHLFSSTSDINMWRDYLSDNIIRTKKEIDRYKRSIIQMEDLIEHIDFINKIKTESGVYWLSLPQRNIIVEPCSDFPSSNSGIAAFQKLYRCISKNSLITAYRSGALLSYDKSADCLKPTRIFIDYHPMSNTPLIRSYVIPSGKYLCVNFISSNYEQKAHELLEYIVSKNYNIRCIVEEEAYLDFFDYDHPLNCLQILV